jgi:hypothetical protein
MLLRCCDGIDDALSEKSAPVEMILPENHWPNAEVNISVQRTVGYGSTLYGNFGR